MFETKPRESMNRSLGALLIAFSLFLSGCTSETEKPLDPLLDEDGDGLSNGWELDRGFDPRNASDVLICQGQANSVSENMTTILSQKPIIHFLPQRMVLGWQ